MLNTNFQCNKCPRTFKLEEFYEKHKKVHELKKQHKCDICGFVYGAAKGLEGHIKAHTDEEIAAAHNANRKQVALSNSGSPGSGVDFHFLNPQGVLAQAKLPVSPVKKDQGQPKTEVLIRDQLNGKAPSPAGTGNYTVYDLNVDAVPEVNDANTAAQNDSGFFMCTICKREFSGLNSLKKHIPIHTRKIQHKCDVCGYVFGKKEYLLDHIRKHTGEVSPICEVCGQTFNKSLKLKEHFKLHRNNGPNASTSPYKCHICQAEFARPDILGTHLTVAHAETVYKCDICEATFGDVRGKNHHMYHEHQLDAFHQKCAWCPVCNQGFTRPYNLKVHMYKSHGKDYIENNFSAAELQALMKSAPVPSPPTIPTVVTQLQKPGPLSSKTNQIQKPGPLSSKTKHVVPQQPLPLLDFSCNMCGSKFLNRNKLIMHKQLTHGVIPIPCSTCGDKFESPLELAAHNTTVHKKTIKRRKPGPASKTNAPPEKRGSNSIPTYLQLTQVSRRSSVASTTPVEEVKKEIKQESSPPNPLADIVAKLASAAASKNVKADEKQTCNFCTVVCSNQMELTQHLVNEHFKGLIPMAAPAPGSALATPVAPEKCSSCPRAFMTKDHLETHIRSVHRAKEIRRTLGLDNSPTTYRRPGPKRARLSYTRDTEDQHAKETDELRPSLLAARSDAADAAKEAQLKEVEQQQQQQQQEEMAQSEAMVEDEAVQEETYEPITEDFMFEDIVISPCYIVLPYVSEEEVDAAGNNQVEMEETQDNDYLDDEAPLTIDESIVDDEPELPRSTLIKGMSEPIPEEIISSGKVAEYNAEDINNDSGEDGGYYPAMADYSLPFSMANIWKKKADELGNFNAMEHLALMEKIEQMQKYNGSVVYSGPPASPPTMPALPLLVNGHNHDSPKKPKTKGPNSASPPKEKKFIAPPNGANQTPVADYENQIKNDIWPLDCIKCNSLLGNLDNFNLHMNDHWSDDKCCPVCGLLINSKRFNFKQHLKIHTGEKPFTCNVCNRSFRQKAHMVKHVTTHSNGNPAAMMAPAALMAMEAK